VRDEPTVQAAKSLFHTGCPTPGEDVLLGVPLALVGLVVFHIPHYIHQRRGGHPVRRATRLLAV
jgi:hypothetical protein